MPMADVKGGAVEKSSYRLSFDAAYGIHKNWMVKVSGFGSDMFQPQFKAEGASLYTKYRFLSVDDFHKHFRMAGFGKIAYSGNPINMTSTVVHQTPSGPHSVKAVHGADELNLDGNHSGWQTGVVATQLIHKLALSGSLSYIGRIQNESSRQVKGLANAAAQYTFSAGYLLFPKDYESYGQTNLNLYVECIGQSLLDKPGRFFDIAPAVQLIVNSKARIDFSYRFQTRGNMSRFNEQLWLLRFEYNFLQAFRKE